MSSTIKKCQNCIGRGSYVDPTPKICPKCAGHSVMKMYCNTCYGLGYTSLYQIIKCSNCAGSGYVNR